MSDIVWQAPLGVATGAKLHRGCAVDWSGRIWCTGNKGGGVTGTWLSYSDDRGATWTTVLAPWSSWDANVKCERMIVDYDNHIIYAFAGRTTNFMRLYYSVDGGANWSYNPGPAGMIYFNAIDLPVLARDNSLIVFGFYGGLFRTTDRGATWTNPIPIPSGSVSYRAMSVEPSTGHIYLIYQNNTYTYLFYKSVNNGVSWTTFNPTAEPEFLYTMGMLFASNGAQLVSSRVSGYKGIYRSENYWVNNTKPYSSEYRFWDCACDEDGRLWFVADAYPSYQTLALVYSDDNGLHWTVYLAPASVASSTQNRVTSGPGAFVVLADSQPYAGVYGTGKRYVLVPGIIQRHGGLRVRHQATYAGRPGSRVRSTQISKER